MSGGLFTQRWIQRRSRKQSEAVAYLAIRKLKILVSLLRVVVRTHFVHPQVHLFTNFVLEREQKRVATKNETNGNDITSSKREAHFLYSEFISTPEMKGVG